MTREDLEALAPPWVIFSDDGKPVAILPAGRSGEVANVDGLSMETVGRIVEAANGPDRFDEAMSQASAMSAVLQAAIDAKKKCIHLADQRDRALALLRDPRVGTSCGYPDEPMAKCSGDLGEAADVKISDTCWWHRRRALLADVAGPDR